MWINKELSKFGYRPVRTDKVMALNVKVNQINIVNKNVSKKNLKYTRKELWDSIPWEKPCDDLKLPIRLLFP